jgi:hypothetical protein
MIRLHVYQDPSTIRNEKHKNKDVTGTSASSFSYKANNYTLRFPTVGPTTTNSTATTTLQR